MWLMTSGKWHSAMRKIKNKKNSCILINQQCFCCTRMNPLNLEPLRQHNVRVVKYSKSLCLFILDYAVLYFLIVIGFIVSVWSADSRLYLYISAKREVTLFCRIWYYDKHHTWPPIVFFNTSAFCKGVSFSQKPWFANSWLFAIFLVYIIKTVTAGIDFWFEFECHDTLYSHKSQFVGVY